MVMAVAEWVVTGEAAWVADGGTSERVAVRAVVKLVARMVVAAAVLAAEVERAGVEGAVGQERASVATSDG